MAFELTLEVKHLAISFSAYELYEQGSQIIKRSSKSIKGNMAEGYGRMRYKNKCIKYLSRP